MTPVRLLVAAGLLTLPALVASAEPGPGAAPGLPAVVREARALLRRHRSLEALERLEADGGPALAAPERTWIWAQVAPLHRGRAATRARLAALPRSGLRTACLSLLDEDPHTRREDLRNHARRGGDPWLLLALATVELQVAEHRAAAETAGRARARGSPFVRAEALQVEARALAEEGRLAEASARAHAAVALTPEDSRPLSLAAELARRRGDAHAARAHLAAALALDPGSESYARRLADLLRDKDAEPPRPDLRAALRAVPREENAERLALEAVLEPEPTARAALLERALAAGANPVPLEHDLSKLLAAQGRHREMAARIRGSVPPDLPASPQNLLRDRWEALERAVAAAPTAAAPPDALGALARALVGVGAVEEAHSVAARAGDGPLIRDLAAHLAFVEAVRREVEAGYRDAAHKRTPPSIRRFLTRVHEHARAHLPPADAALFALPTQGVRHVAILGTWLDHGASTTAPIVGYFRRYGRYLVVGQRNDQPVETILLSLAFLAEDLPIETRGQHHRHDLAVGYDRTLRSWLDFQGGGLAGACLPDALWLDADAALSGDHDARRALTRDPSLLASARRLPTPPADTREGPFALGDTGGVGLRLLARYAERTPGGRWGSFGTLRAHENGHVIDIRRHLPLWHGLPATVSLLCSVGFACRRMEAVLERRAQLASVIDAPDPDLAVEEMVEMLPVLERDPEVHAAGYRDALDLLVRHVWANPRLYPEIDRSRRVLPQLDRLDNEQLRQAARAVVDR